MARLSPQPRTTTRTVLLMIIAGSLSYCLIGSSIILYFANPTTWQGSQRAVEIRNALLARESSEHTFAWTSRNVPATFKWESLHPPDDFREALQPFVKTLDLRSADFENAKAIVRHLDSGPATRTERPVMADVLTTYKAILEQGDGYCADFAEVFTGIALNIGLAVREWGIGFGGFGAGHALNEIFDHRRGRWIAIDSHLSVYFLDKATGEPASILDVQNALEDADPSSLITPVFIGTKRGNMDAEAILEYYARGVDGFYLYWGNNVWSFEDNAVVSTAAGLSPAAEQAVAMMIGVHPGIRLLPTERNDDAVEKSGRIRGAFLSLFASLVGASILLIVAMIALRKTNSARLHNHPAAAGVL